MLLENFGGGGGALKFHLEGVGGLKMAEICFCWLVLAGFGSR